MLEKLQIIRENVSQLVPPAVDEILHLDYWAGLRFKNIYYNILSGQGINSEEYEKIFHEEFRRAYFTFASKFGKGSLLYILLEETSTAVRSYLDANLENLDLEEYQPTIEKVAKYQYRQKDYHQRLIQIIKRSFPGRFGLNGLHGKLQDIGKPTKPEGSFVLNALQFFVQKGKLIKERKKNRIYYTLKC
tara:strand:+ start:729 stop:1295 length:567 start_codon:yes stop_codon:yes gene_type:complete